MTPVAATSPAAPSGLTWCPGCGHRQAFDALVSALQREGVAPSDTVVVTGMGCASLVSFHLNAYGLHGVHGRVLPLAIGVKAANPRLSVIVVAGDGDTGSIGLTHLLHAARRNYDLTYLILDNLSYGMTGGQPSATSNQNGRHPLNVLSLVLAAGGTFVAQSVAWEIERTSVLIGRALRHRGFSVVNILSPCPTFHRVDQGAAVSEAPAESDGGLIAAIGTAFTPNAMPVGVLYETERPPDDLTGASNPRRQRWEHESIIEGILDKHQIVWR
ncbi:MAG: thiamine pyrophosphate-dependent enzyme [Nitrospirota bacterium]